MEGKKTLDFPDRFAILVIEQRGKQPLQPKEIKND
jgi:hypothetical protein